MNIEPNIQEMARIELSSSNDMPVKKVRLDPEFENSLDDESR
jgi:hypothetical protein